MRAGRLAPVLVDGDNRVEVPREGVVEGRRERLHGAEEIIGRVVEGGRHDGHLVWVGVGAC
eukprot:5831484-Prymnesium_polylepis.1